MAERGPKYDDMGVDWDAEALRAAAAPFPYTEGSFFEYFKDLVKPHDKLLDLGCNIASWIWAWRDVEPTIEYHGLDWSEVALKIANDRYGSGGSHLGLVPATFHHADAREMDFTEVFDIVFTHTFYQHTNLETKKIVVPRVRRALKFGGLHIIQENTSYDSSGTWLTEGWIKFFEGYGFKLERVKNFHDGGSGFVFRRGTEDRALSSGVNHLDLVDTGTPEHNWERHYLLKEGDVFVEAGAFWGRYGKIASRKVGPRGKVVLIEASPENQQTIEALIKRDSMGNVTLVRGAVWSSKGRRGFVTWGNPAGHRLAVDGDSRNYPSNISEVDLFTLDDLLPGLGVNAVDLLACDVEGAEVEMVKGADKLLDMGKIRNVALAAYHAAGNPEAIIEILGRKGFKALKYKEGIVYGHL